MHWQRVSLYKLHLLCALSTFQFQFLLLNQKTGINSCKNISSMEWLMRLNVTKLLVSFQKFCLEKSSFISPHFVNTVMLYSIQNWSAFFTRIEGSEYIYKWNNWVFKIIGCLILIMFYSSKYPLFSSAHTFIVWREDL